MAGNYDATDLAFSFNGDFSINHDGDIADTADDGLKSIKQEIHDIAASVFNDWELYPNRAAGLDDFVGEPNTSTNGDRIHDRLRVSLVSSGIVSEDDLEIRVIPVNNQAVLIVVKISALPTPYNELGSTNQPIITSLVFDFVEQGIFVLPKTNTIGRLL